MKKKTFIVTAAVVAALFGGFVLAFWMSLRPGEMAGPAAQAQTVDPASAPDVMQAAQAQAGSLGDQGGGPGAELRPLLKKDMESEAGEGESDDANGEEESDSFKGTASSSAERDVFAGTASGAGGGYGLDGFSGTASSTAGSGGGKVAGAGGSERGAFSGASASN